MSVRLHRFQPCGGIPNSPLPLAIWPGGLPLASRNGDAACALYVRNGWEGVWVYTVFPYWHFHTKGHEVLSCVEGTAKIAFGGDDGIVVDVSVGDVVIVPAGVGHKRLSASAGFRMAGAYPPNQQGDIVRSSDASPEALALAIAQVALPQTDPISGKSDRIVEIWH